MQTQELIQSVNYYRLIIPKLVLEPEKTGKAFSVIEAKKAGKIHPVFFFLSFRSLSLKTAAFVFFVPRHLL